MSHQRSLPERHAEFQPYGADTSQRAAEYEQRDIEREERRKKRTVAEKKKLLSEANKKTRKEATRVLEEKRAKVSKEADATFGHTDVNPYPHIRMPCAAPMPQLPRAGGYLSSTIQEVDLAKGAVPNRGIMLYHRSQQNKNEMLERLQEKLDVLRREHDALRATRIWSSLPYKLSEWTLEQLIFHNEEGLPHLYVPPHRRDYVRRLYGGWRVDDLDTILRLNESLGELCVDGYSTVKYLMNEFEGEVEPLYKALAWSRPRADAFNIVQSMVRSPFGEEVWYEIPDDPFDRTS